MAKNQNTSIWILKGQNNDIDLSWLHQDKRQIYVNLERLGFPTLKSHYFPGKEFDSPKIDELFKLSSHFCRLIPNITGMERPYKKKLATVSAFRNDLNVLAPDHLLNAGTNHRVIVGD